MCTAKIWALEESRHQAMDVSVNLLVTIPDLIAHIELQLVQKVFVL